MVRGRQSTVLEDLTLKGHSLSIFEKNDRKLLTNQMNKILLTGPSRIGRCAGQGPQPGDLQAFH